ncbi:Holliday junction branch migration protein RuvA [Brevibacterium otitidis]|uniref:Holliday junction branch migration complex subunit RuvA n=1 Tax=Brevibacterium otitidis TaxID=53364 RepID=A0ABV5X2Y1_9MICO|nr:Holliday junction branch migration protein RuvA [Brevibacterium otitidis]
MITFLSGTVHSVRPDSLIVVTAGIGRRVFATPALAAEVRRGQDIELHTVLVVREDSLTLYGFGDAEERDLFETLQTISGIGPRLALAVLSVLSPDELHQAIADEDQAALTKVPGVGKKVAARLMLELAGKLSVIPRPAGAPAAQAAPAAADATSAQVVAGLVNLGWSQAHAEKAVAETRAQLEGEPSTAELLKATLKSIGGRV